MCFQNEVIGAEAPELDTRLSVKKEEWVYWLVEVPESGVPYIKLQEGKSYSQKWIYTAFWYIE